jgi:hypothetical protein
MRGMLCGGLVVLLGLVMVSPAGASFVTFETGQVRPLAMSPDGTRLFAVNTPDDRLEIFDIGVGTLTHVGSVPVGLEPVAIAAPLTLVELGKAEWLFWKKTPLRARAASVGACSGATKSGRMPSHTITTTCSAFLRSPLAKEDAAKAKNSATRTMKRSCIALKFAWRQVKFETRFVTIPCQGRGGTVMC